jgi:hypothetical protein
MKEKHPTREQEFFLKKSKFKQKTTPKSAKCTMKALRRENTKPRT